MRDTLATLAIVGMLLYYVGATHQEPTRDALASSANGYTQDDVSSLSVALSGLVVYGRKAMLTPTMEVSAHFNDTGDVWCFQVGCMHQGTDYSGVEGTPVYAPFDMTVIALGEYPPGPTWGQYIQCTFADGYVFYAGHLQARPDFQIGQVLPAGTQIGVTNGFHHTHIQLAKPGDYGACAQRGECIDFEQFWNAF